NLLKDISCGTIRLASGNVGNKTQYQDFPWPYYPLIISKNEHPITRNIDPVLLKYASTIDTLKNDISKTILLESSQDSKPIGTPVIISLDEVSRQPVPSEYDNGNKFLGVLLEGAFTSAYSGRVRPFETRLYKDKSVANKMVVIADGDVIANELYQGQPMALGVDKWTRIRYGNSTFLMNTVNYLLDDSGLLKLRSKTIQLQFLDKQKAYEERSFWQLLNVLLPLLVLAVFGLIYTYIRKRRFS
ncbi:MAG: gliding motility-associated ABC transporter substrate-binding protein GldG, partial [Flavobacteriaceae bacterium]|nr:gliding motility-associated ABC transporter substrate-binding protein GldG [Flavobacteriaceae bacterium]